MRSLIELVEIRIKEKFSNQEGSHDYFHIDRVRRTALLLQKTEGGNAELIELAALLHDYSDHKYNGGDFQLGQKEVYELLISLGASKQIAHEVANIVAVVSFKGALVADHATSLEGQIVRDADRLDAIGAIGIARAFSYGGSRGRALYDPSIRPTMHQSKEAYAQDKGHTVNHFYEKLLLLKDRMQTKTAKELASQRHDFMLVFLDTFKREWEAQMPDTF